MKEKDLKYKSAGHQSSGRCVNWGPDQLDLTTVNWASKIAISKSNTDPNPNPKLCRRVFRFFRPVDCYPVGVSFRRPRTKGQGRKRSL